MRETGFEPRRKMFEMSVELASAGIEILDGVIEDLSEKGNEAE